MDKINLLQTNLWNAIKNDILRHRSMIPTFKGEAHAEFIGFEDERIVIQLEKGDIKKIRRSLFENVIQILETKSRVRQADISTKTNEERYVLGLMSIMTDYFEKIKEHDEKGKRTSYLIWTPGGKERLADVRFNF